MSVPPHPPNRLLHETSPYLLQHAYNPVQWHPWGEEALAAARTEQRPIFLSIGYSACHWCHVMEHESFENPDIARLMNDWFINIKVDREERPDLDQIYMNAVQLLTHRGGWPMSVFLTPDLKPFFGGTYWPPDARMGMPGFRDILRGVHDAWRDRRQEVLDSADRLTSAVIQVGQPRSEARALNAELLQKAAAGLCRSADRREGGFGRAPKFPHPMDLRVLLRAWKRFGDAEALSVVQLTLDKMAGGGIYDHLGGGFHRYSTDERWLVPHFEKMLYDNALLTPAYLEAFQATGDMRYAQVARETLDYVLREMTHPEDGSFYSTQDADSEGVEGKFFVWQAEEILEILGPEDGRIFNAAYDVTPHGNWEESNILHRARPHKTQAELLDRSPEDLDTLLRRGREKLLAVRSERIWPGRDEKILTGWNGLMISAFALAAQVLGEPKYAAAARRAADFLLERMRQPDGELFHSYKDGRARFNAYLDDYASLVDGLIDLYQATFEPRYLTAAADLADRMVARFHDPEQGGFFFTSHDHEKLISRQKDLQDNATPSGNGTAGTALVRLGRLIGRNDLEDLGVQALGLIAPLVAEYPSAGGQMLIALDFLLGPAAEIVVVDGTDPAESEAVLRAVQQRFLPNKLLARKSGGTDDSTLPAELAPLMKGKTARGGAATIYICEHGACGLPVVGVAGLETALANR